MGDYTSQDGTDLHMTLADARYKAQCNCIGSMKEIQEGYTTIFIEESTGRTIGTYYER